MDTETTLTTPASDNLTLAQLIERNSKRVNSPAPAPAPSTSPAGKVSPDNQPGETTPADPEIPVTDPAAPETPEEIPAAPGEPTEPETPVDPETETEPTEEEIPKDEGGKVKRIHSLLKDRKEARELATTLQGQLDQAQTAIKQLREGTPPNVTAIDRFSAHPDVQPIDARLAKLDGNLDWYDANLEGGEVTDGAGKVHPFTAAEVRSMRRNDERTRQALVVERAQKVDKLEAAEASRRQAAELVADKSYPWLKNQQAPEFQVMLEVAGQIPGVLHSPEMTLVLGDLVRGRMARLAEAKAKAAPLKRAAAPPNITTTAASAPRVTDPLAASVKQAQANYEKTGRTEDLIVLNQLRAKQKAAKQQQAA